MHTSARSTTRAYIVLTSLTTLALSLVWGVDTLLLLDAGLSITQVFIVNSCFMVGQLIFEIPTGIIADAKSRKLSFLLGCITLSLATLGSYILWSQQAPIIFWILNTLLIGLGFTFFSGATEAWLVDALTHFNKQSRLDTILAWGQSAYGVSMLIGTISGGLLAEHISPGTPYLVRSGLLLVTLLVALKSMHDTGFTPQKHPSIRKQVTSLWKDSLKFGIHNQNVRWMMLTGPFLVTSSYFTFYALQPYLLQLHGDKTAYSIAGLAAAIVAGSRIIGGLFAPKLSKLFATRTSLISFSLTISTIALFGLANVHTLWGALMLVSIWGIVFTTISPARQAYIHGLIPSKQRATIVSFDSMLSSSGSALAGPVLGRTANSFGFEPAYIASSCIQLLALPFVWRSKANHTASDTITPKTS